MRITVLPESKIPFPRLVLGIKRMTTDVYRGFKAHKLKWSITVIILLVVLIGTNIQALRIGYYKGSFYEHQRTGLISLGTHLNLLEAYNAGDTTAVKQKLEIVLNIYIMQAMPYLGESELPWYMGDFSGEKARRHRQLETEFLGKAAQYRKKQPSPTSAIKPESRIYKRLMRYLPKDSTVSGV